VRPPANDRRLDPVTFSQEEFIGDPSRSGMLEYGYVHIPSTCAAGQRCRVHVAFHGCRMSAEAIGTAFVEQAGYNRWAETNGVVVLYPQIKQSAKPVSNPRGCWDWFAYTGPDFARRSGLQMQAVRRMIAALAGS
jgi:poly(3-hydroxybutyrate) depolymerase